MKIFLRVLGGLFILVGIVWILQGVNILPGSFMTGHIEWAVAGVAAVVLGAGAYVFTQQRPK